MSGEGPAPALVLSLIRGLPQGSWFRARRQGSDEHLEWNRVTELLASIYDAINVNTTATGQWKKGKAPKIPAYPRPDEAEKKREKKPVTVKDIWQRMTKH